MLAPQPSNNIIAYNKIMNGQNSTVMFSCNTYFLNTFGTAFVQNILEHSQRHAAGNALADFSSSDNVSTNTPATTLSCGEHNGWRTLLSDTTIQQPVCRQVQEILVAKEQRVGRSANKGRCVRNCGRCSRWWIMAMHVWSKLLWGASFPEHSIAAGKLLHGSLGWLFSTNLPPTEPWRKWDSRMLRASWRIR